MAVIGEVDVDAIASTISETASDIFIYDTRKDSDGGAWRKRTQNTSWYNETLNTSFRGSRKEFPQVAVIVTNVTNNKFTIYDGDDPDLPMWMEFGGGAIYNMCPNNYTATKFSVSALNGIISVAGNASDGDYARSGIRQINFIKDGARKHTESSTHSGLYGGNIEQRNDNLFYYLGFVTGEQRIVNSEVNDVAMTVLPNAPIDDATGLPIPTIAVATEGGVSVITDSGNVVDSSFTTRANKVAFLDDFTIAQTFFSFVDIFTTPYPVWLSDGYGHINDFNRNSGTLYDPNPSSGNTVDFKASGSKYFRGASSGVDILDVKTGDENKSSIAYITSNYNTGWMQGDIKLATLSDTDDTNVTGSELVTNGDFSTGDLTGWSDNSEGGGSATVVSNELVLNTPTSSSEEGRVSQQLSLTSGEVYVLSFEVISGDVALIQVGTSVGASQALNLSTTSNGKQSATFTAGATNYLVIRRFGSGTLTLDDFSIRIAEEDRSVNGNGLQVFGTITKSAVATGADLVGYTNFTDVNYIKQPENADIQADEDFCFMVWIDPQNTSSTRSYFSYDANATNEYGWAIAQVDRRLNLYTWNSTNPGQNAGEGTFDSSFADRNGTWNFIVVSYNKNNNNFTGYLNGERKFVNARNFTKGTNGFLIFGGNNFLTTPNQGKLSLFRYSRTIPTDEQIKKIYNDEKFLFQENAQATLYGTSDAVTALAFDDDTNLLHVGTSAGRSVFQGLKRVENTTDAVGSAISASNGMVADE